MYICICNSVTDRDIAAAVDDGARTLTDLELQLGVGTCCGQCRGKARECLRQLLITHDQEVLPVVVIQPPPAAVALSA